MNVDPLNKQLYDAVADLARASDHHAVCANRVDEARAAETAAMNAVNEAQKRFDAIVAEVKKQSPRQSDWRRPPGLPV